MILSYDDIKERAAALEKCIWLAKELLSLRNYNGLYAVLSGISHGSVSRMKLTMQVCVFVCVYVCVRAQRSAKESVGDGERAEDRCARGHASGVFGGRACLANAFWCANEPRHRARRMQSFPFLPRCARNGKDAYRNQKSSASHSDPANAHFRFCFCPVHILPPSGAISRRVEAARRYAGIPFWRFAFLLTNISTEMIAMRLGTARVHTHTQRSQNENEDKRFP